MSSFCSILLYSSSFCIISMSCFKSSLEVRNGLSSSSFYVKSSSLSLISASSSVIYSLAVCKDYASLLNSSTWLCKIEMVLSSWLILCSASSLRDYAKLSSFFNLSTFWFRSSMSCSYVLSNLASFSCSNKPVISTFFCESCVFIWLTMFSHSD